MLVEPTETFTVMLMIPGPAVICGARGGAITQHTISIVDDDSEYPVKGIHEHIHHPPPTHTLCMYHYKNNGFQINHTFSFLSELLIRFEQESYEVNEGDGNVNIKLVLVDGTILRPFDVSIEFTNGTAMGG